MTQTLVPNLDLYIQNKLNILLYGRHGVGKTHVLEEAGRAHGLKVKYFSCSTLDPFTDLVGIPYPDDDPALNKKVLNMIRFHEIDDANIIFFDELNRAQDSKTLNAVLEIVQFRRINGEKLPNLVSVWAAVNPPDDEYQVQDLDPALVDRFDVFHEIKPQVSVPYLKSVGIDSKVAQACQEWWKENQKDKKTAYISPRRIEKMARLVTDTNEPSVVKAMLPPGENYDSNKLIVLLKKALGKQNNVAVAGLSGPVNNSWVYTKVGLTQNSSSIVTHLQSGTATQATITKLVETLSEGIGTDQLAIALGPIIENLPPSEVEGMVAGWSDPKRSQFKKKWADAVNAGYVTKKEPWNGSAPAAPSASGTGTTLAGMSIVVTGKFPGETRASIQRLIEDNGGQIAKSVSYSTSFLLHGAEPGDTKVNAARERNVEYCTWVDFKAGLKTGQFKTRKF